MYKSLNFLKFRDIHKFELIKFLHKILYKNHSIFHKYFSYLLPTHSYLTRNTRINLPQVRLDVGKRFTIYKVCVLMNEIPVELINPQTKYNLKKTFFSNVISQY